jgi:hypothetical protein
MWQSRNGAHRRDRRPGTSSKPSCFWGVEAVRRKCSLPLRASPTIFVGDTLKGLPQIGGLPRRPHSGVAGIKLHCRRSGRDERRSRSGQVDGLTSFCAGLYGRRAAKNRAAKALATAQDETCSVPTRSNSTPRRPKSAISLVPAEPRALPTTGGWRSGTDSTLLARNRPKARCAASSTASWMNNSLGCGM